MRNHFATITIPTKGNSCGGQYCLHNVNGYFSIWKVKVCVSRGVIYLGTPRVHSFNNNESDLTAMKRRVLRCGGFFLSEAVFDGERMTIDQFLGHAMADARWQFSVEDGKR